MILTEAFLAVKAVFVDGKLNVDGGLLGTMYVRPQASLAPGNVRTGSFFIVSLVRTGPSDHQKPHALTIDFTDAAGKKQLLVEDAIVFDDPAEGGGCWISPITMTEPQPGLVHFNINLEGGGKPLRLPVQVRIAE
jgi:hypothetical protein